MTKLMGLPCLNTTIKAAEIRPMPANARMVRIMMMINAPRLPKFSFMPKITTPKNRNINTRREVKVKLYRVDENRIMGTEVGVTSKASRVP